MVMEDFIKSFPSHIDKSLSIAETILIEEDLSKIDNIVITGQGGSAIGGLIAQNILRDKISIPVIVNRDYTIPNFVSERTFFIASSYSGNTEETITALKQAQARNSFIFCVCSGGEILKIAKENKYNYAIVPSGGAPRAMLCYSLIQILYLISIVNNLSTDFLKKELQEIKAYLVAKQEFMIQLATDHASNIGNKMPFIYTFSEFEGVAIRFKQQLNENSKHHATYNLIPEMNHNEIVAWASKNMCVIPIFLKGNTSVRNKQRMDINIQQINNCVDDIIELKSDSDSYLTQYFYFIHLVDWISLFIANKKNIDPDEIESINYLKESLKKL